MPTKGSNVVSFVARALPRRAEQHEEEHTPLKILVIDDSPEDRMIVRFALETKDYVISEAENGKSGLASALATNPDCILLDYRLPDLDGLEVLDALRSAEGHLPAAVVMLTGSVSGPTAATLLKAGALDYLAKQHMNHESLRRSIQGSVERFRLMEEHRKLQERNAHLAAIITASSDAIICVGLDLVVQTWNPGATMMFGYCEAEAIGRTLDELIVPNESLQAEPEHYRAIVAEHKAVRVESTRHRKDGSLVPVEITAAPIRNESEKTIAISVTFRDISQHKAVEADLIAAKSQAERANRAKSTFLAAASHDLRQPVQSLVLLLDVADRRTANQPKVNQTIGMMKVAIDGLQSLLTSVLDISRLDAGVVTPVLETVDLDELLLRLKSEYAQRATANGLELRMRLRRISARTDPNLLSRALRNLIENALRYTSQGGVLIGVTRRGERARIDVYDTGVGIAEDKRAEIFEEFHQLNNPGRNLEQGLGLGLSIVARLASLIGGKIEVASNLGRGSRFSLLLPLAQGAAPVVNAPLAAAQDAGGRILIIEDNAIVRQSLEEMLREWGYDTIAAVSGEDALESAAQHNWSFDALIADHRLGAGLTGVATAKEIERCVGRVVPTVILTGDTEKERIAEIAATGFGMLHKPIAADSLRRKLANLLSFKTQPA